MAFPFKQAAALDNADEELRLYLGEVKVISVRNPARVAIGNPLVADIAAVTKNDLTLSPKSAGNTTLVVWDNYGEQSYVVKVFNENTNLIKSRIDNILKQLKVAEVNTQAQDEEGKVFLLGKIKNDKEKEMILTALGPLKEKIVDLMAVKEEENVIEIDVQVFEINKGAEDKLGFKWPQTLDITEVGSPGIAAAGTSWGKLFKVANVTRDAFTLTLDALIQEGSARVLSRPRIACLSGKEAKLLVGGQVPVLSGSITPGTSGAGSTGATTGASVEYKDYGIVLNIKPQVNEQGRVHINLNVEVSELGERVETDYALAYTFIKRSATSELILDDGQTMAIGGLIKQKTTEELQKFPWLGDVPVLGMFFRHKRVLKGGDSTNREDVELFITLTPRIVVSHAGKVKEARETAPADKYYIDEEKDPVLRYSRLVQARILESLNYPPSAKGSGFQGIVTLRMNLSYKGEILESGIQSSSGYKILDDNALKAAKKTSPYPPFPPAIKEKDLWINIPIAYQLD
jgi:pilus assembly protein CpaC